MCFGLKENGDACSPISTQFDRGLYRQDQSPKKDCFAMMGG